MGRVTESRRKALGWSVVFLCLVTAWPGFALTRPTADATAAAMHSLLEQTGIPGMTFAIVGKQLEKSYAAGLADKETGEPMREDSLMMGGSTGKMIVAVLVYQEVHAGRLRLADKVSRYLGTDRDYMKLPGATEFTLAMLLSHSSGLIDGTVDYAAMTDSSGAWTADRRFKAAQSSQLLAAPGTVYSYSDLNYQILAAVLEVLEHHSFEALATDRVLRPLGMRHTVPALLRQIPGLASGYAGPTSGPQYENISLPDKTAQDATLFMNPAFEGGGGGFATCSPDMARFVYALFSGRLLDAPLLERMTGQRPVLPIQTDRPRVAAGAFSYDTPLGEAFGHTGLWFGYKTLVAYYPALKVGAAMQVNSQIDAAGADLQQFKIDGRELSMIQALSLLVQDSLNANAGAS